MNAHPQIIENVKRRLTEVGLSATEAAKRAGVSSTTLTRPLNDSKHRFVLSTSTLQALCGPLRCELSDLVGGSSLGEAIRTARKARNLGQADIADQLSVTVQAVSQWERDENMPTGINLLKLSGILGIDLPHGIESIIPDQNNTRLSELREQLEEVIDLLHAIDKIGDGIGGADGYSVSAVAIAAKSMAANALDAVRAMGGK